VLFSSMGCKVLVSDFKGMYGVSWVLWV
jgi:hypothetical protein